MSNESLKERFSKVLDNFYEKDKYLCIEMMKLGYPEFCNDISTAGVSFNDKTKRINFLFNKEFFNKLSDTELEFIIAHELMHIIGGHLLLFKEKKDLYKRTRREHEIGNMIEKLNKACDIVINDSLVYYYKFPRIFDTQEPDKMQLCYGKNIIKMECYDLTAQEVFDLIPEDDSNNVDNHNWDSFFDKNGNLKKEFADKLKEFVKKNINNSKFSDKELNEMEKFKDVLKESKDINAGGEIGAANRAIENTGKTLKWDRILSDFVDTRKVEDVWTKPNRSTSAFYPKTILPFSQDTEIQEIVVFVDSSGSIDYSALSLFISLIENTPKHIKIKAFTFDTKVYPYDIKKDKQPIGNGGTNFQILEDYIQANFKKYPKCCVVMSDGDGTNINCKHPNKWLWLLYGSCNDSYIKDMKHYLLQDLIK